MNSNELNILREQIDRIDQRLLLLLTRRLKLARAIGTLKESRALPLKDRHREKALLAARVRQGKSLGLDERFVSTLMQDILKVSRQVQRNNKKKSL